MEEFTNCIKGKSLSFISGLLDRMADSVEYATCEEERLLVVSKLRCIAEEIFNRGIDSQESYIKHDYELSKRVLARVDEQA